MSADIYELTQNLIKKYRTNNPYEIAEALNIVVKRTKFDNLKGMYKDISRIGFVWLNDELDETAERVVLMHEIGHHLLHRHLAVNSFQEFTLYDMSGKPEMEANIFAADMLVSDNDVIELAERHYTSEQAACELCIPHQLMLIKIKDMISRGYDLKLCREPKADFFAHDF